MGNLIFSALVLILATPSARRADGGADYKANCARCHGQDAKGNGSLAKLLKVDAAKLDLSASSMSEAAQVAISSNGKGKMPEWDSKLSKDQIASIVKYMRTVAGK